MGTVWLAAGRPTATITVNVLGDRVAEFNEEFTVTLGAPTNGLDFLLAGAVSATGRILNDDAGIPRATAPAAIPAQAFASLGSDSTPPSIQAFAAQAFAALSEPSTAAKKAVKP